MSVLFHWEWGKPTKQKVNILWSFVGMPRYLLWGRGFLPGMIMQIMGHFGGLWWFMTSCNTLQLISIFEWIMAYVWMSLYFPREEFSRLSQLSKREHWNGKKHYLILQDLLGYWPLPSTGSNPSLWPLWWMCTPSAWEWLLCPRSAEHSVAFANGPLFWVITINILVSHILWTWRK